MIPFYIFYSMFGFQRVGDLAWAAGDSRARGFLIGGTSGRTTLNGEGLQHEDGHSHLLAATIPNCVAYDPTYGYEVGVIVRDGLRRMVTEQEDVFYYLTVLNENYVQPPLPEGAEEGILRGLYLLREAEGDGPRVQLLGSGAILREVLAGADLLASDFGVAADVWSVDELHRAAPRRDRGRALEPAPPDRGSARSRSSREALGEQDRAVRRGDRLHALVRRPDPRVGPGPLHRPRHGRLRRSDYRRQLRRFFEVDRHHVAVAALEALAREGRSSPPSSSRRSRSTRSTPSRRALGALVGG